MNASRLKGICMYAHVCKKQQIRSSSSGVKYDFQFLFPTRGRFTPSSRISCRRCWRTCGVRLFARPIDSLNFALYKLPRVRWTFLNCSPKITLHAFRALIGSSPSTSSIWLSPSYAHPFRRRPNACIHAAVRNLFKDRHEQATIIDKQARSKIN